MNKPLPAAVLLDYVGSFDGTIKMCSWEGGISHHIIRVVLQLVLFRINL